MSALGSLECPLVCSAWITDLFTLYTQSWQSAGSEKVCVLIVCQDVCLRQWLTSCWGGVYCELLPKHDFLRKSWMSQWKPTKLPAPLLDILTDRGSSTMRAQQFLVGIDTGATETYCRVAFSVSNSWVTFLTSNNKNITRRRSSWIPQDCRPSVNHVGIVPLYTSTVDGCSLETAT